jgi:hypothetical protein
MGPFLKIVNYKKVSQRSVRGCVNSACKKFHKDIVLSSDMFCPTCGNAYENFEQDYDERFCIHAFTDKHFKDCDMFCGFVCGDDYIVITNRSCQGGEWLDEEKSSKDISEISSNFSHEDWKKLFEKFEEHEVSFEKHSGIVQWYN